MKNNRITLLGNTYPVGCPHKKMYSWWMLTMVDGLKRLGYEVQLINYRDTNFKSIVNNITNFKSSHIWTHLTFHKIHPVNEIAEVFKKFRKNGIKIGHFLGDARTEDRYLQDVSEFMDYAFMSNHEVIKNMEKHWNIPMWYLPYGSLTFDEFPKIHSMKDERMVFTGTRNVHQDRINFLNKLDRKTSILYFSNEKCLDRIEQTKQLAQSSESILALCTGYDSSVYGFMDVRFWQYLGAGGFVIGRRFPIQDLLIPNDLYIGFNDYSDNSVDYVIEQHNQWLYDKTTLKKNNLQKAAFDFIQEKHSSIQRVKYIFDCIDGKDVEHTLYI